MVKNSVELIDKELAACLERASSSQLRAAALAACRLALERTGLTDPIVEEGLKALANGNYSDVLLRSKLRSLVDRLDREHWRLKELIEQGRADEPPYPSAFHKARAVNAVYAALDSDAFEAAADSIYEAYHATNDLATLAAVVVAALTRDH